VGSVSRALGLIIESRVLPNLAKHLHQGWEWHLLGQTPISLHKVTVEEVVVVLVEPGGLCGGRIPHGRGGRCVHALEGAFCLGYRDGGGGRRGEGQPRRRGGRRVGRGGRQGSLLLLLLQGLPSSFILWGEPCRPHLFPGGSSIIYLKGKKKEGGKGG